jgi:hypothetical protein
MLAAMAKLMIVRLMGPFLLAWMPPAREALGAGRYVTPSTLREGWLPTGDVPLNVRTLIALGGAALALVPASIATLERPGDLHLG